ncbi:hypothetical protein Atai01_67840 [Amycolatopsis taiwanensis]|uniref:Uncharacterized protein n=1 Tax=Amycolatopsis taiwanensis TaxID=342230 RepID=A0A9W6RA12_9PSEU|nr:hypothetical protein Atai01_67840 [Amycolatopsis taiwanensis]
MTKAAAKTSTVDRKLVYCVSDGAPLPNHCPTPGGTPRHYKHEKMAVDLHGSAEIDTSGTR